MKKKYLIILLLVMILMPFKVFAAGGFDVSSTSISMYPGESKTITISTNNAVGKLNISSSNGGIASATPDSVFIQNPGSSGSITVTGNSVGTATISVVASDNFATMDEEILVGQTRTVTVNVIAKPTPTPPSNNNNNNNGSNNTNNTNTTDNKSTNNNIKELSVNGYELEKVDNNNYTLLVSTDVENITIKATAEDSKAKVTGAGKHDLKVGENNIEIIVTSESGAQNKINIKVTRKDGYYLEDLESVLNNNKINDINIIIDSDSKLSSKDIERIKNSEKTVKLNYYDKDKKLIYSWIIDGSKISKVESLTTTISYTSENTKEISKLSNYADGLYVTLKHNGNIPPNTKIKLYVGDKFTDEDLVNVYYYDKDNVKLDFVKGNLTVKDGYIEFYVDKVSDYFVTMSKINNITDYEIEKPSKSSPSKFLIIFIILIVIIIALLVAYLLKRKSKKKQNNINIDNNSINNQTDNANDNITINPNENIDNNINNQGTNTINNNINIPNTNTIDNSINTPNNNTIDNSINTPNNNTNVIDTNYSNLNGANNINTNINYSNPNSTNNVNTNYNNYNDIYKDNPNS